MVRHVRRYRFRAALVGRVFGVVPAATLLLWLGMLAGCATPPEEVPTEEAPAQEEPAEDTAPEEEPAETAEPEAEPEEAPPEEAEPQPEPEPEPEEPAGADGETAADGDYEVTEEVYNQTFNEVEKTIEELNKIIRDRDFDAWRSYLTDAYEERYSDPEELRDISNMPILQRNDITLRSLRDYFRWVVVPSRANARLDDLRFITEDEVEAIMSINGQQVILYHLKKVDGSWKIYTS